MARIPQLGAMTVAAALIAVPVMAQNAPTRTAAPANTTGTAGSALAANPGTSGADANNANPRALPGTSAMTSPGAAGGANSGGNAGGIGNAPATGSVGSVGNNAMNNGAANSAANNNAPSDKNPVLTDDGQVRASKVIGSSVYNDHNDKIGTIDDILMGKDNQPATAVISVGGFLGIGSKLVTVPYDKLQFGDTKNNNGNRVVMPGADKNALNGMPDYHYTKTG